MTYTKYKSTFGAKNHNNYNFGKRKSRNGPNAGPIPLRFDERKLAANKKHTGRRASEIQRFYACVLYRRLLIFIFLF